jgi:hypothetical protein
VESGFKDVEEFVQQIANWPKSKELATIISMEVFEFDETFIAEKISKVSIFQVNIFKFPF